MVSTNNRGGKWAGRSTFKSEAVPINIALKYHLNKLLTGASGLVDYFKC